jgi:hypothetical protein
VKDAIKNLLKVKSLMTIAVMVVFVILSLKGKLEPTLTASVITSVITYYFTKKDTDKGGE